GVKNIEITERNGPVMNIAQVHEGNELLVITEQGKILRTPAGDIRTAGRATQGVRLMDLEDGDRIVSMALVDPDENGNGNGNEGDGGSGDEGDTAPADTPEE